MARWFAVTIDFLIYALAAGLMTAAIAGPLGSLMVWQRMAYFGDTLAHSSLLGVALGLIIQVQTTLSVIVCCLLVGVALIQLQRYSKMTSDTLLAVLSHSALALGLIVMSVSEAQTDLNQYLMGDLLSVNSTDLVRIGVIATLVLLLLFIFWRQLVAYAASPILAMVEGLPVGRLRLLLVTILSLVIAIALSVVGVLLISALLIIPAASAKQWAKSPEQMAWLASVLAAMSVVAGLGLSVFYDFPAGPAIVICCGILFVLSLVLKSENNAGR